MVSESLRRGAARPSLLPALRPHERGLHEDVYGWFNWERTYQAFVELAPCRPSVIVEVGSFLGRSAMFLAREVLESGRRDVRIDCVDPWGIGAVNSDGLMDHSYATRDRDGLAEFTSNLINAGLDAPIKRIRMTSLEAARLYPDCSVDAVFLDALHDFESVWEDLRAWWPKVRVGGMLAGHDYFAKGVPRPDCVASVYYDVSEAVKRFFGVRDESYLVDPPMTWVATKLRDDPVPSRPKPSRHPVRQLWFDVAAQIAGEAVAELKKLAVRRLLHVDVVDLGCWDGSLVEILAERASSDGWNVWGVDSFDTRTRPDCEDRIDLVRMESVRDPTARSLDPYKRLSKELIDRYGDVEVLKCEPTRAAFALESFPNTVSAAFCWSDRSPKRLRDVSEAWGKVLADGAVFCFPARSDGLDRERFEAVATGLGPSTFSTIDVERSGFCVVTKGIRSG